MLIVGISREQVCQALLVTDRAVRKWINAFNRRGVDGLIANKRPGRTALIGAEQAAELATVVDHPVQGPDAPFGRPRPSMATSVKPIRSNAATRPCCDSFTAKAMR